MPRFYCPSPLAAGTIVELPEAVAHHLHVLRLQAGDALDLFNGDGLAYCAKLASLDKRRASAAVLTGIPADVELPYAITLAQALPEGSKMDWIVEKAVELGVSAIAPLAAQRSVVRLSGERADKRLAHWHAVVIAASEQCGRNRLAQVAALADLRSWLALPATQPRILLSPRATVSLSTWASQRQAQSATLMVGPEGGFTHDEEAAAEAAGATLLSIGPRVLRTETAGLAALSTLNAIWGGF